ncbi:MAG: cation:proton antiporter [Leptospiraceae bacterium]|nr:cation:proton antiporter [Leptospiraceae bacterium]
MKNHFSIPFTDPIAIIFLMFSLILFAPIFSQRLKIPGIIGLIFAGILVGPNSLNLLSKNIGVTIFSTIGLLYLMFLAGLEIDIKSFQKNKNRSLVFGLLTFSIPFTIGCSVFYILLDKQIFSTLFVAIMFSTHTLLSYPIASRFGLSKTEVVTITTGGTIITDSLVLFILTILSSVTKDKLDAYFWLRFLGLVLVFMFVVVRLVPIASQYLFKKIRGDSGIQYLFVLFILFFSAFGAELAGLEPMIGAFLSGLVLNKFIPHTSALMNRILFIGNTLFIPFFLISVGMIINIKAFFSGIGAIVIAVALITVAITSKFLAAYFTQKIFKYSNNERNLIFGLSNSHAAATIAVILVGHQLKWLDETILNATVLLILVSCIVSSFVTQSASKKIVIQELEATHPQTADKQEKILVSLSNPSTMERLLDFSFLIKNSKPSQPIYPLMIVLDDDMYEKKVMAGFAAMEKAIFHASATETLLEPVIRVDLNPANGISRAIKEISITKTIIGWNEKPSKVDFLFGTLLENLLNLTDKMLIVTRCSYPLDRIGKVQVWFMESAELEFGFSDWVSMVVTLVKNTNANLVFNGNIQTIQAIRSIQKNLKNTVYNSLPDILAANFYLESVSENDLVIFIAARQGAISYQPSNENLRKMVLKYSDRCNFVIVYPEQKSENRTI